MIREQIAWFLFIWLSVGLIHLFLHHYLCRCCCCCCFFAFKVSMEGKNAQQKQRKKITACNRRTRWMIVIECGQCNCSAFCPFCAFLWTGHWSSPHLPHSSSFSEPSPSDIMRTLFSLVFTWTRIIMVSD